MDQQCKRIYKSKLLKKVYIVYYTYLLKYISENKFIATYFFTHPNSKLKYI